MILSGRHSDYPKPPAPLKPLASPRTPPMGNPYSRFREEIEAATLPVLVVTDHRCVIWKITYYLEREAPLLRALGLSVEQVAKTAIALHTLDTVPEVSGPLAPIVVDDGSGPHDTYWRQDLYPGYKEGRSEKSPTWWRVHEWAGEVYRRFQVPVYRVPKYEADDLAAYLVSRKRAAQSLRRFGSFGKRALREREATLNRIILLNTVDSDWLQLIGNGVWWYNINMHQPRLRGVPELIEWAPRSSAIRAKVSGPEDVVKVKHEKGDPSDNLPPGRGDLVDLLNLPSGYQLSHTSPTTASQLSENLFKPKVTISQEERLQLRERYLRLGASYRY